MEMQQFMKTLKATKPSFAVEDTRLDIKVISIDAVTKKIYTDYTCSHCKNQINKSIVVTFKKPLVHFTIFQAEMLYRIFMLNKKPYDYAGYDKCEAGKEFIENIEKVEKA